MSGLSGWAERDDVPSESGPDSSSSEEEMQEREDPSEDTSVEGGTEKSDPNTHTEAQDEDGGTGGMEMQKMGDHSAMTISSGGDSDSSGED